MKTITKEVRNVNAITEEPKLDLSLFKKRGNSKTYAGYLIQKMKEARDNGNQEFVQLINHFYKKYIEFQTSEKVRIKSWKGKSSLEIIEQPDRFIIITFQKPDKDETPKEVRTEVTKQEVNEVLLSIYKLDEKKPIPTSAIAEATYKTDWKKIFSNREVHIKLTKILELLEYKGITKYSRRGFTTLLNQTHLTF